MAEEGKQERNNENIGGSYVGGNQMHGNQIVIHHYHSDGKENDEAIDGKQINI